MSRLLVKVPQVKNNNVLGYFLASELMESERVMLYNDKKTTLS